jgi:uncharacterized protein
MVSDCLADEGRFGVVLIARGSEVGGGDERVTMGTMASIETATPGRDGRWHLVVVGTGLLRVTRWLADDPYPRALVERCDAVAATDVDVVRDAQVELRRVRALVSELGQAPAPLAATTIDDDPDVALWQLCALAPVTVLDRQHLLEAPGPDARAALLRELVGAVGDDVRRILAGG